LGNGCALFLSKFLAKLVVRYNELCDNSAEQVDKNGPLDAPCYKQALQDTLLDLSVEDMQEHGRLLTLKEKLIGLC